MVGHSFGGLSVRLYSATYPADVAGLVLLDPPPPTFVDDDCAIDQQIEALWQQRAGELAASVPTGRLEIVTSGHDIQLLHPEAVVAVVRSVLADRSGSP